MIVTQSNIYVIMSSDRQFIAKGTPRDRCLVRVDDTNRKRFLTYTSKKLAENGFKHSGFYGMHQLKGNNVLEAVECEMTIRTI